MMGLRTPTRRAVSSETRWRFLKCCLLGSSVSAFHKDRRELCYSTCARKVGHIPPQKPGDSLVVCRLPHSRLILPVPAQLYHYLYDVHGYQGTLRTL